MKKKGIALVTALIFTVIIVVLVTVASIASLSNRRSAADNLRTSQAQFDAEAGLDRAVDETWYKIQATILAQNPNSPTNPVTIASYQAALNSVIGNGASLTNLFSASLDTNNSYSVSVSRTDNTNPDPTHNPGTVQVPSLGAKTPTCATLLVINSTGTLGTGNNAGTRRLQQNLCITGQDFKGLDYALLTNNANCIFCHMQTQSLDALGGAASSTAPWRKTKLGTLQTIAIRQGDDYQSTVAGTIQTRGQFLDATTGNAITSGANSTLKSLLTPGATNITNSSVDSGGTYTSPINLSTNVDCLNTPATCIKNQNFYFNYPTAATIQNFGNQYPDGQLPDNFPPPVPHTNGYTFAQDFAAAINNQAAGTDKDNPAGSITGNIGTFTSTISGQPSWSTLTAPGQTFNSGGSPGQNVVLDGNTNPISCGGASGGTPKTIYIQGDLIIRGKIKGSCKIVAQGNIYVMGDLKYVCGSDNHLCTDSEYANPTTSNLPAVALMAGQNMMVGDYLTPRLGNITDPSVIDAGQSVASKNTNDSWGPDVGASTRGTVPSMAWREVALFNQQQLIQYLKSPGTFIPRFYTMRDYNLSGDITGVSSQIPFWTGSGDQGVDNYTDPGYVKIPRSCITKGTGCVKVTVNGTTISASTMKSLLQNTLSLSPTNQWIGESALKNLWIQSVENTATTTNSRAKGKLRTDGLLYSSNGIFAISKCCTESTSYTDPTTKATITNYTSNTQGQWDVRGSIIAADTGILVTGNKPLGASNNTNYGVGLNIYHDYRLSQFFKIQNQLTPALYRSTFQVLP
jgi:Tfp pilus assembly protein PilX